MSVILLFTGAFIMIVGGFLNEDTPLVSGGLVLMWIGSAVLSYNLKSNKPSGEHQ